MGNLRLSRNWHKIGTLTVISAIVLLPCYTLAQVTPDQTLGNENSTVNQIDAINERIDGGARRGGNLFHSFQEFNINEGRGVYFTNPPGVMNIFSRVTGGNASQILGKLGVLGESNLFFLNPYGIIFGPNSSLDIRGSFVGSTANGIRFGEEGYFSATDVEGSSLLSINPGVLISNQLEGAIINRGNLIVDKDLTLSAGILDLQGQLVASGNLTLEALNTVQIRDSITNPFIAYAGGKLLIQGNQFIDIFALNHPQSGLFSGGDLDFTFS
jgi:filamentous hemagglutinin family protein